MVLGACLSNGSSWWQHAVDVCGLTDPADLFFDTDHRLVAEAMQKLTESGGVGIADGPVADHIASKGIERLGPDSERPADFIFGLLTTVGVSTIERLERSVGSLREYHRRRTLISETETMLERMRDPDVSIDSLSSELEGLAQHALSGGMRDIPDFGDVLDRIMNEAQPIWSIPTGFDTIDRLMYGYEAGRTYVMAAGSGVGKTSTMFRSVRAAVYSGAKAIVYSLESSEMDVLAKVLSGHSSALWEQVRDSLRAQDWSFSAVDEEYRQDVIDGCELFRSGNLKLISQKDMPNGGLDDFPSIIMKQKELDPETPIVIFLDYLQLMTGDGDEGRALLSEYTRQAHNMAQSMDVAMVLLSQLNRKDIKPGHRPRLDNLYGSSAIQNNADGIILMWRPAQDEENDEYGEETMFMHLAKNRIGGEKVVRTVIDPYRCVIEEDSEETEESGGGSQDNARPESRRSAAESDGDGSAEVGGGRRQRGSSRRRRGAEGASSAASEIADAGL